MPVFFRERVVDGDISVIVATGIDIDDAIRAWRHSTVLIYVAAFTATGRNHQESLGLRVHYANNQLKSLCFSILYIANNYYYHKPNRGQMLCQALYSVEAKHKLPSRVRVDAHCRTNLRRRIHSNAKELIV